MSRVAYKLASHVSLPVAEGAKISAGDGVCLDTGYAVPASVDTGLVSYGVALEEVDNTDGSDGAVLVDAYAGGKAFPFANSSSTDEITAADRGATVYWAGPQQVAKTNGTNTRSAAGKVFEVDADGVVWVTFG